MSTTIEAITRQLAFTATQTARVEALLAGREVTAYRYQIGDVLDACRAIEQEDGWHTVAEPAEILQRAAAAQLVALQTAQLWEALEKRQRWGSYQMIDVIEAFLDVEDLGWGAAP